jgi:hypothetical protein
VFPQCVPDAEGADLAEPQMRGEPAGSLDPGDVPAGAVLLGRAVEEILQPPVGPGFPGLPGAGEAGTPVRPAGEQPPAVERVTGGDPSLGVRGRGREALRGVQRQPGLLAIEAGPPEGREDLVRPARPGAHRPRLKHQVRLEAGSGQALVRGPGFDAGIHLAFGASVAAVPEQRRGAGLPREIPDDVPGGAAAQQQA